MTITVKKGDIVKVEYRGTLEDGTVFDESKQHGQPLEFEVGAGQMIKGFDTAVEGMKLGEEKEITLQPEEAYGPVREQLMQTVPRDQLPEGQEPEVGMMLGVQLPDGQQLPARITEVNDTNITLDLNHPLAGKELTFWIKLIGLDEAAA